MEPPRRPRTDREKAWADASKRGRDLGKAARLEEEAKKNIPSCVTPPPPAPRKAPPQSRIVRKDFAELAEDGEAVVKEDPPVLRLASPVAGPSHGRPLQPIVGARKAFSLSSAEPPQPPMDNVVAGFPLVEHVLQENAALKEEVGRLQLLSGIAHFDENRGQGAAQVPFEFGQRVELLNIGVEEAIKIFFNRWFVHHVETTGAAFDADSGEIKRKFATIPSERLVEASHIFNLYNRYYEGCGLVVKQWKHFEWKRLFIAAKQTTGSKHYASYGYAWKPEFVEEAAKFK